MRVAIDTSPLSSGHAVRGVGAYTRQLLLAMQDIGISGYRDIKIEGFDFKTENCPPARRAGKLKTGNWDLIHYPYFDLFFLSLPLKKLTKTIVTIHDVIPLIYPKHYKPGIRGWLRFQIQKFSLKGVGAIITDSESSKKDIVRFLDVPQEKITVIHLAPNKKFKKLIPQFTPLHNSITSKYGLPEKFILYVGDVNYNKNIEGLIKAFALLNSKLPPCRRAGKTRAAGIASGDARQNSRQRRSSPLAAKLQLKSKNLGLVLVGSAFKDKTLQETQQIFQLIEKLKLADKVIMPGFVPAKGLVAFYNLATVYCQPSFYEGFGLPVLEAMSCGCPVVAAKTQTLVEIAGNVALLVNPKDPKSIARGLFRVLTDKELRSGLVERGLAHVQGFSWEKTARATLEVYRKAAHG